MTRDAVRRGAQFVIWPESSTPFMFEDDAVGGERIRALARETGSMLLGSDQMDRAARRRVLQRRVPRAPDGTVGGVYRKMHLVPFGEYMPLKQLLFFVAPLVERSADFSPGRRW